MTLVPHGLLETMQNAATNTHFCVHAASTILCMRKRDQTETKRIRCSSEFSVVEVEPNLNELNYLTQIMMLLGALSSIEVTAARCSCALHIGVSVQGQARASCDCIHREETNS